MSKALGDARRSQRTMVGATFWSRRAWTFGLAHIAGGPTYVVVASVAGIGYGWIYAATGSIGGAILAHAGLNAIHFLFFSYPALARVG